MNDIQVPRDYPIPPTDTETRELADVAIAEARANGCTCAYPNIWLTSTGPNDPWSATVAQHDNCYEL